MLAGLGLLGATALAIGGVFWQQYLRADTLDASTRGYLRSSQHFEDESAAYDELKKLVRDTKFSAVDDITAAATRFRSSLESFEREQFTYEQVAGYYRSNLQSLAEQFPEGTFRVNTEVLAPFSGKASLGSPPVYIAPFVLLSPENYFNPSDLKVLKLRVDFQGKSLYGLRVSGKLIDELRQEMVAQGGNQPLGLPYVASLNARLLGFTHAQLIPEASENVTPARMFDYNGLLPWEKHNRYRRTDQISKPLLLTNVAHMAGPAFNISDHPDFAFEVDSPDEHQSMLTFFLWHREASSFNGSQRVVPDFIFQLLVTPG